MNAFVKLFKDADVVGKAAADACVPVPMIVREHANPLNDNSRVVREYAPVMGGACGFAWVNIKPGNCAAANYAKKVLRARKSYYGGVDIWVGAYGQSMAKKESYAAAFAGVLAKAGVSAYSMSRMD